MSQEVEVQNNLSQRLSNTEQNSLQNTCFCQQQSPNHEEEPPEYVTPTQETQSNQQQQQQQEQQQQQPHQIILNIDLITQNTYHQSQDSTNDIQIASKSKCLKHLRVKHHRSNTFPKLRPESTYLQIQERELDQRQLIEKKQQQNPQDQALQQHEQDQQHFNQQQQQPKE